MAEQFLTLMADLDIDSQNRMSEWYNVLKEAGFNGIQAPGLPYHISLTTFTLEQEQKAVELTERVAGEFAPIQVHVSHIGIFAPGKVLFGAPERNAKLELLHDACEVNPDSQRLWTPHVTLMIDEPAIICKALPLLSPICREDNPIASVCLLADTGNCRRRINWRVINSSLSFERPPTGWALSLCPEGGDFS